VIEKQALAALGLRIEDTAGTIAIFDGFRSFEIWALEQSDAWYNAGFGPAGSAGSTPGSSSSGTDLPLPIS